MFRKPTRRQMADEWRARADAARARRLKEVALTLPMMRGDIQAIFGRIIQPGELPSTAPIGSQEQLEGTEELQWLTRRWEDG